MYAAGVLLAGKAAFFMQTSTENYLAQACTKQTPWVKKKYEKEKTPHPTKVCRFRLQECQESTFKASLSDT